MENIVLWAAIIFAVWLVLFLALRWVMLWYFRLNDIGNTLHEVRDSLRVLEGRYVPLSTPNGASRGAAFAPSAPVNIQPAAQQRNSALT
jgi:predicted transcriptional regulator